MALTVAAPLTVVGLWRREVDSGWPTGRPFAVGPCGSPARSHLLYWPTLSADLCRADVTLPRLVGVQTIVIIN